MLEKCFDGIEVFSVQKNLILFVILGKIVNSAELPKNLHVFVNRKF